MRHEFTSGQEHDALFEKYIREEGGSHIQYTLYYRQLGKQNGKCTMKSNSETSNSAWAQKYA